MTQRGKLRLSVLGPLLAGTVLGARLLYRLAGALLAPHPATLEQNRSRSIIQNASDAIISTDETQHILLANPSAAAMFGTTVKAMEGAPLNQFIPRRLLEAGEQLAPQQFGSAMKGRRATDYAVTGLKSSGEQFPLEGSLSTLAEDGRQIYTIILRDVTERKQVQEKLEQSYSQLRELSAALQTIREEERTHISRELHDDLGQLLATLRMDLTLLQQQPAATPEARKLLRNMDSLLLTAITSLRRIAGNLRPRALDEGGLYFALQSLRHDFTERHGILCELDADEEELRLDDTYSTAIFRIAQEALTNIARHAQASHVWLRLWRADGLLYVVIRDDGRGISNADMDKATSFGLIGMRERVWAIHGNIAIGSDGDSGTRIDISLPLPPSSSPPQ